MRIGISGSFGMHNLGDEAILESIMASIRDRMPTADLVVFSRNAVHTEAYHGCRAVDVWGAPVDRLLRQLADLDVFVLGGGGIIYDADIGMYLRQVELASLLGVPIFVYAVGAGPLEDRQARRLVGRILSNASVITTRDEESMRLLLECGVKAQTMEVAADPALLLKPCGVTQAEAVLVSQGIPVGQRLVGVSVRQTDVTCPWLGDIDYHGLMAKAMDAVLADNDVHALFIPMEPTHDIAQSEMVLAQMEHSGRATILQDGLRPSEVMGVIGLLELALGMRLHFNMFAAVMGVPVAPLFYAPKVNAFIRQLGLPIPEQDMSSLKVESYLGVIKDRWRSRASSRPLLKRTVATLKERAEISTALLFERVLGEEIIRD